MRSTGCCSLNLQDMQHQQRWRLSSAFSARSCAFSFRRSCIVGWAAAADLAAGRQRQGSLSSEQLREAAAPKLQRAEGGGGRPTSEAFGGRKSAARIDY